MDYASWVKNKESLTAELEKNIFRNNFFIKIQEERQKEAQDILAKLNEDEEPLKEEWSKLESDFTKTNRERKRELEKSLKAISEMRDNILNNLIQKHSNEIELLEKQLALLNKLGYGNKL
jgi:septal ring factor EnvC (AmiA/AmiB activator)